MKTFVAALLFFLTTTAPGFAGENLKLNPHLDFNTDSQDGPLITEDGGGISLWQTRLRDHVRRGMLQLQAASAPHG